MIPTRAEMEARFRPNSSILDIPCAKCRAFCTEKGHDACIPDLPLVNFACCGHGKKGGYISFHPATNELPYRTQVGMMDKRVRKRIISDPRVGHVPGSEAIYFYTTNDMLGWISEYLL